MNADTYAEKVVRDFITDITDYVFLAIEQNDELMREYMSNVNSNGLTAVNTSIGRTVKELLNLDNDEEVKARKSRLIETYTKHKIMEGA